MKLLVVFCIIFVLVGCGRTDTSGDVNQTPVKVDNIDPPITLECVPKEHKKILENDLQKIFIILNEGSVFDDFVRGIAVGKITVCWPSLLTVYFVKNDIFNKIRFNKVSQSDIINCK